MVQDVGKAALPAQVPCHKAHWKAGHKKECARFAAEAEEMEKVEEDEGGARLLLNRRKDRRRCTPRHHMAEYAASHCSSPTGGSTPTYPTRMDKRH